MSKYKYQHHRNSANKKKRCTKLKHAVLYMQQKNYQKNKKKSFTEDMEKNKSPRLEAGKVFSTKSDTLCLTPNSHMIEEEIQYSYVVL